MTNLTNPNYIILRNLILKSEGKTIEDELEFGCLGNDRHGCLFRLNDNDNWKLIDSPDGWGGHGYFDKTEILGLPISLDRVLIALGTLYCLDGLGHLIKWDNLQKSFAKSAGIFLDLRQPLYLQSPETIDKLIELLK